MRLICFIGACKVLPKGYYCLSVQESLVEVIRKSCRAKDWTKTSCLQSMFTVHWALSDPWIFILITLSWFTLETLSVKSQDFQVIRGKWYYNEGLRVGRQEKATKNKKDLISKMKKAVIQDFHNVFASCLNARERELDEIRSKQLSCSAENCVMLLSNILCLYLGNPSKHAQKLLEFTGILSLPSEHQPFCFLLCTEAWNFFPSDFTLPP